MEQSNDKLYRLILSMSKSEKSFFKKYASIYNTQKDSNYLALYEALDAAKDYNEKSFLKKYQNQHFIKNFSATKAYLYETILKSLLAFKSGKDKRQLAEQYLIEAEILLDRSIYSEAENYIEKGKAIAKEIGHISLILRYLEMERTLYGIYKPADHEKAKLRIMDEINRLLQSL